MLQAFYTWWILWVIEARLTAREDNTWCKRSDITSAGISDLLPVTRRHLPTAVMKEEAHQSQTGKFHDCKMINFRLLPHQLVKHLQYLLKAVDLFLFYSYIEWNQEWKLISGT